MNDQATEDARVDVIRRAQALIAQLRGMHKPAWRALRLQRTYPELYAELEALEEAVIDLRFYGGPNA